MNSTLASVTPPDRDRLLAQLDNTPAWDVIVIGGGATGLGTAVDAASRGYRTLLIEGADFAKGTSSKATKLVHGGVRYLAQGNVSLCAKRCTSAACSTATRRIWCGRWASWCRPTTCWTSPSMASA